MKGHFFHKTIIVLLACSLCTAVSAAEVRGTVNVAYQGLFGTDANTPGYPVSVALLPAQGQRMKRQLPVAHRIDISQNRMQPAFITVQLGAKIEFVNLDNVYHQVFSLSSSNPVSAQIGKADSKQNRLSVILTETGITHFFCRIHSKSYARIDVVNTPYLQMVSAGKTFHFSDLAPGRWNLRLAAPAAETQLIPVTAVTTPPPLNLTLASRGGGSSSADNLNLLSGVERLFADH